MCSMNVTAAYVRCQNNYALRKFPGRWSGSRVYRQRSILTTPSSCAGCASLPASFPSQLAPERVHFFWRRGRNQINHGGCRIRRIQRSTVYYRGCSDSDSGMERRGGGSDVGLRTVRHMCTNHRSNIVERFVCIKCI